MVVDNHLCVNRDGGDGNQVVKDVEPVSDRFVFPMDQHEPQ